MPYVPPRRTTSTSTSVIVSPSGVPTWPQSVAVSSYASVPLTQTIAQITPSLAFIADQYIGASYSQNLVWNENYGPGGGGLFTGGGHSTSDYPFAWVFDGSLPGWVSLSTNALGPTNALADTNTYATGAEFSLTQANMPGSTLVAGAYWCRRQGSDADWGYPSIPEMNYGEYATGVPGGFHSWNSIFEIPPNKLGLGSKGGWGTVCHHSMTRMSGKGVAWGHKIDAATGLWSRMPARLPNFNIGNDMGAVMHACSDGTYAYTKFNYLTGNGRPVVRTDLTTGAHTVYTHSNAYYNANNILVIPGTSICVYLTATGGGLNGSGTRQTIIGACDVGVDGSAQVECTMGSNTMPSSSWWDSGVETGSNSCFGQAGLAWVPEVGKLAAFHQAPTTSTNGTWPMKLYWITPPSNVQTTYASGTWTVTEEALTIPGGDTKANSAFNRGTFGYQYGSFAWSSKLRCFLHFPRPGTGMCFFIRTSLVP